MRRRRGDRRDRAVRGTRGPLLGHPPPLPEVSFTTGSSTVGAAAPRKAVAKGDAAGAAPGTAAAELKETARTSQTPLTAGDAAIITENIPHQPASHGGAELAPGEQEGQGHHLPVPQGEPPGLGTAGSGSSTSWSWRWDTAPKLNCSSLTWAGQWGQHSSAGELQPRQLCQGGLS